MENLIKKIDEKLSEMRTVEERLIELGLVQSEEEKEFLELEDYLREKGYTDEEIDEFIEMDLQEEELQLGAPMGNQNAAGPHTGGKWTGKRQAIRRAQWKKDTGGKISSKNWKKMREVHKSLKSRTPQADKKKRESFKKSWQDEYVKKGYGTYDKNGTYKPNKYGPSVKMK